MDHTHPYGKPISILSFSDSKEVVVDSRELGKIFNHPEIQDRKVVILSIIGAFRGGKSFFLDYCLRFLYAHFTSINNRSKSTQNFFRINDNWMGGADEPLKGFSWRSGTKRETVGINIWSDVFLHSMDRTGEEIAIFLMDTQGLFDNDSTPTDNSRIFALGTLISSIQVLNLKQQIQEDQLQYLQFATEFAQFNAKKKGKTDGKPFQNLTFLIRDWQNFDDFDFGSIGGQKYFEEDVLKIKPDHASELRSVREFVKNSFDKLECCLLPHPGRDVSGSRNFDGRWSKMDKEFKSELQCFIEHLLMPDKMTLKKFNSRKLTVKEVKVYIEDYLKLFKSGEVPKIPVLYQFMLNSTMDNLIKKCIDQYKAGIYNDRDLKSEESIPIVHKKWKSASMRTYDNEDKMGDMKQQEASKDQLDQKLEGIYREFKNMQEQRFRELRKEAERHRVQLEEERKRKEQVEQEKRQKEAELAEAKAKMERERREAEQRKKQYDREMKDLQEKHEREQREIQKKHREAEDENRRKKEQADRERKQRETETQARLERERREAAAQRQREEERWQEIQEEHERQRKALQRQLDEEEQKRKDAQNSFGNNLWKGIKAFGIGVSIPLAAVGGAVATGTVATVGTIIAGPEKGFEAAGELASGIVNGYKGAIEDLDN